MIHVVYDLDFLGKRRNGAHVVVFKMADHQVIDFLDPILLHKTVNAIRRVRRAAIEQHGFAQRRDYEGYIAMADVHQVEGGLLRGRSGA